MLFLSFVAYILISYSSISLYKNIISFRLCYTKFSNQLFSEILLFELIICAILNGM